MVGLKLLFLTSFISMFFKFRSDYGRIKTINKSPFLGSETLV